MNNLYIIFLFINFLSFSQNNKINGIGFVSSDKAITQANVKPIVNVNANYVALNPFAIIRDLNSPEVVYSSKHQWFGESAKGIKQYAKEFNDSKIKIMLKPQIWVLDGKFTGFIKMKSETDWKIFEASYKAFILEYAQLATDINAAVFLYRSRVRTVYNQ